MIYLDYSATTQMSEEALQTYIDTSRYVFGNSQSLHSLGLTASSLLNTCRQKLASFLSGEKEGIIFTSGATEANVLAIETLLNSCQKDGNHLISTSIEHASVKNYLTYLETKGYEITYLPVDSIGKISLSQLNKAIPPHTILATNPDIQRIPTIKGTTHEFGLRGGTVDLPAVAAFTTASELCKP